MVFVAAIFKIYSGLQADLVKQCLREHKGGRRLMHGNIADICVQILGAAQLKLNTAQLNLSAANEKLTLYKENANQCLNSPMNDVDTAHQCIFTLEVLKVALFLVVDALGHQKKGGIGCPLCREPLKKDRKAMKKFDRLKAMVELIRLEAEEEAPEEEARMKGRKEFARLYPNEDARIYDSMVSFTVQV